MADIVPPAVERPRENWLGSLRHTGSIIGDIIEPTDNIVDWEANR